MRPIDKDKDNYKVKGKDEMIRIRKAQEQIKDDEKIRSETRII
jgi:hypothetical protein